MGRRHRAQAHGSHPARRARRPLQYRRWVAVPGLTHLYSGTSRMRIAILDPAAGISGDMTLGALLSLGVPAGWLEELPQRLGFAGVHVTVRDVRRSGVGCKQVEFHPRTAARAPRR